MATHDYIVDNQNGANFRSDLNNALAAIVSNNSSATAPTTTYAFMLWADTANDLLKQRNAADSAWISILTLSTGAPLADYADNALSGNAIDGGTISNFTSTGIDDNATGTKLTISDTTITGVGAFTSTSIDATKLSGNLPAIDGSALTGVGKVLQVIHAQYGAMATGTGIISFDNTIPQITEGTEFMTRTITPSSATSILYIDVVTHASTPTVSTIVTSSLFVGTTADALATSTVGLDDTINNLSFSTAFTCQMVAGVTSELTFRVRIGGHQASTTYFNGWNTSARMGGTLASTITITEVSA